MILYYIFETKKSAADYDQETMPSYQRLIASLKLVEAVVQNDIRDLELAQSEYDSTTGGSSKFASRGGFFDQLLNRKARLLNKRMKSVALGFGK